MHFSFLGANIHKTNRLGCTLLHCAAQFDYSDIVKYFIEKGVNPDLRAINGATPLSLQVRVQRENVVQALKLCDAQ